MVRLSLGSWLNSSSKHSSSSNNNNNNNNDNNHDDADIADRKRANRRSFAGLSTGSPFSKPRMSHGSMGKTATAGSETPAAADPGKAERPSATSSSTTQASGGGGGGGGVPPSSDAAPSMTALAATISRETARLEKYLEDNGLPLPAFGVNAPADFPKLPEALQKSRLEVIHATKQLRDLTVGPRESLRWGVFSFLDVLALQIINNYGLAKLVPDDSPIPLTTLQRLTPLDPVNLARTLRTAMTSHIFAEPAPGLIAHTAASRLLAADDELAAWIGFNAEDIFPAAAAGVLTALRTHPEATSPTRAGFQVAFGTVDVEPMFATFARDTVRARRMGRAMASLTGGEGYEVGFFTRACDLRAVDACGGRFVDVGGSHGFVCVDLARRWRSVRFVVQDLAKTVESAPRPVCEDGQVAARVEFMAHDFFTPQTVEADVYYFRWIMHNYATPYAVSILKNLVPALRPGARVIINDHCLREPGQENAWDEAIMRRMDMVMLTLLNAQERTEAEFRELFRLADARFVFRGVTRPHGCRMSIVEAVWMPDEGAADRAEEAGRVRELA